jgi:hypothetical protein
MLVMQRIFLESANSYKGPAKTSSWDEVLKAYEASIHINKFYSVIQRASPKVTVNYLKGYVYRNTNETAANGCTVDGSTTVTALLATLAGCTESGPGFTYIISANSAHQFSYPLSKHAFAKANVPAKRKVVVNFDNHRDYHNAKKFIAPANTVDATPIVCGGWGAFHLGFWSNQGTGGAAYITLGNGKDGSPGKFNQVYSVDATGTAATVTNPTDEEVVTLLKTTYTADNSAIYFSVDRDFMSGNGTKYGDTKCIYTTANGIAYVKKFVEAAAGKIIGQDIIGLPTNGDTPGAAPDATLYNNAVKNVNDYIALFT